jgi:hypothetical protein
LIWGDFFLENKSVDLRQLFSQIGRTPSFCIAFAFMAAREHSISTSMLFGNDSAASKKAIENSEKVSSSNEESLNHSLVGQLPPQVSRIV